MPLPNKKPLPSIAFAVQPAPPPPAEESEMLFALNGLFTNGVPMVDTIDGDAWFIGIKPQNYDTLTNRGDTCGSAPLGALFGGAANQELKCIAPPDAGDTLTPDPVTLPGFTAIFAPPSPLFNKVGVTLSYDGSLSPASEGVIRGSWKGIDLLIYVVFAVL